MKELSARQRQRTDTAARWTQLNPLLLRGEIGYESDTGRFKFGDGTARWNSLSYRGGVATVNGTAPDAAGNVQISSGGDNPYDITVRTQEEFDAMTASEDWLGAASVLLCGIFTIPGTGGTGITIPDNVFILDGAVGAELQATATVDAVLQYAAMPMPEDGRRADNLTVRCAGTGNGFANMVCLTGCAALNCAGGFVHCDRLVSCRAEAVSAGFSDCANLTDCSSYIKRGTLCSGYTRCSRLLNCTATIDRGVYSYGFDFCSQMCNCIANIRGTSECISYSNCSYCTCCVRGQLGPNGVLWSGTTTKRCDATCDL